MGYIWGYNPVTNLLPALPTGHPSWHILNEPRWQVAIPIHSVNGIFTYIYHNFKTNVGKYTIHWACGYSDQFMCRFFLEIGRKPYGIIIFFPWTWLTRQRDEPWNHGSNKSPHNRTKNRWAVTTNSGLWLHCMESGGNLNLLAVSQGDSILSKAWEYWQENPWLGCYEEGEHCKIYTCEVFQTYDVWPQTSANSWKTL